MPDLSRRAILRGATFAGAAAVGGAAGVGTHSLLVDGEIFESNSLQSGALTLELATSYTSGGDTSYSPDQGEDESFPSAFADESNITMSFPNLDPDEGPTSGTTTVAFRACDNPARVWLRADGEQSDLADALYVQASYATECGADGTSIYEGLLSGFLDDFGGGARLYENCTELGKIEYESGTFDVEEGNDSLHVDDVPGTLTIGTDDGDIDVRIVGVHEKDDGDEVIGVDIESDDVEFCRADVKTGGKQATSGNNTGGNGKGQGGGKGKGGGSGDRADPSDGVTTYWLNCASAPSELLAGDNASGNQGGLSHFVLYTCGEETCLDCEPECLTLDWELLDAEGVAGDSLTVDLELFANQCRHTEPTNPWQ